jgi:gliding motility-associated lipoprotein GldD
MKGFYFILFISVSCLFASCDEEVYTPKPRGFAKTSFPEKQYQLFDKESYPYTFEYPTYSEIEKDTMFFDEKTENPWWININFKDMKGKIYISYKQINKTTNTLDNMLRDSHTMSFYHTKRASYINDPVFNTKNNVHGVFYDVGGNSASAFQFFATDSVQHFIRGALYFDVTPNIDSLKPVNAFLQKDMIHLVNTLKWR